jgi:hypothetical protein
VYLLDTNVLSELMRIKPNPCVEGRFENRELVRATRSSDGWIGLKRTLRESSRRVAKPAFPRKPNPAEF